MQVNQLWAVYFSPTGGTKKIVRAIAGEIGAQLDLKVKDIIFSKPDNRKKTYAFGPGDLVIAGSSVYAGRVPNKIMPDWKACFQGGGALAVPVSVFGNRSFDDALMELKQILEGDGFRIFAAAAVANRHAFATKLAPDRPTAQDMEQIRAFAQEVARQVREYDGTSDLPPVAVDGNDPIGPYYTPLRDDGKPATALIKAKPQTHADLCDQCGICARMCPMAAIDFKDCTIVPGTCIKCHACVRYCPKKAKYFDDDNLLSHTRFLEQTQMEPKENRFFYGT